MKNLSSSKRTGTSRGILYTVINTASVIGPLLAGWLVNGTDFSRVYLASAAIFLAALVFFLLKFKYYRDAQYLSVRFGTALRHIRASMALRKAISIRFALSFLSAWNGVYIPLYLVAYRDFSWREINFAFAMVLFVYLIIELPLGKLADKYSAEKKIMLGGGILAMLALALIPLVTTTQFWGWIPILVLLGIGFCSIEIGIETYFFRKVHKGDTEFVSIFRMTNPAALIISMLIASAFLAFAPLQYLFWLLLPVLVWQVWVTLGIGKSTVPASSRTSP